MSEVILINPPHKMNIFLQALGWITPPMSLPTLGAILEEEGIEVQLLDAPVEELSIADITDIVEKENPLFVGLTAHKCEYPAARLAASAIKETTDLNVGLGGPHAHFNYKTILLDEENPFDVCFVGPSEDSLPQYIKYLQDKLPLREVKGIAYKYNSGFKTNFYKGKLPKIPNLNDQPFPAFHLLNEFPGNYGYAPDLGVGLTIGKKTPLNSIIPMVSSRGCSHNCYFCQVQSKDGRWKSRSAENLISEIEQRLTEYGIDTIYFLDDNFLVSKPRVKKFCTLLKKKNIKVNWSCFARADWIVHNEPVISQMGESGCDGIYLGIESTQAGMDYYRKGITEPIALQATAILRKYEINSTWGLVLGAPIDNATLYENIKELVFNGEPNKIQTFILCPFMGTKLHNDLRKDNLIKEQNPMKYDAQHPIIDYTQLEGNLTSSDIIEMRNKLNELFYKRREWCAKFTGNKEEEDILYQRMKFHLTKALKKEPKIIQ